jgi:tetratricopeptide (TPR) repeat protein
MGEMLSQTFYEARQLAEASKADEAISLLSRELSELGFKSEGEEGANIRKRLIDVLVSSALYRVMEEFDNLRRRLESGSAADLEPDLERHEKVVERQEKLVLALDPSSKDKIDAQKEIHRGNLLAFRGDEEGAIKAYQKAKQLDSRLGDLKPEEQVKRFARSLGPDRSARETAIQKIASGNEAARLGELEKAIMFYREAIQLDPQLARSLDPEAEARKWSAKQSGPLNMSPQGQALQESTQNRK